MARNHRVLISR